MPKKQEKKKQETGRSMVEMLGVLAIMGVISAGGLYGFNTAMDKHRANELINEAQKRAAIVAMQIATGKQPSESEPDQSLFEEFTDLASHEFKVGKKSDKQFNMKISGVSEEVCEEMQKMSGGTIVDFSPETCATGNENTVELVFNNDLSPIKGTSGGSEGSDSGEESVTPVTGCTVGSTTGLGGPTGQYDGTDACKCLNIHEVYTDNGCEDISTNCPSGTTKSGNDCICNKYDTNQCGLGYYCKFDTDTNCNDSGTGKCVQIPNTKLHYSDDKINGGKMNWWTAYSFCKGLGLNMVTGRGSSSVQCGTLSDHGPCTSQPTQHPTFYWLNACTYSTTGNNTCDSDSCNAFFVGKGNVSVYYRAYSVYVLCE